MHLSVENVMECNFNRGLELKRVFTFVSSKKGTDLVDGLSNI